MAYSVLWSLPILDKNKVEGGVNKTLGFYQFSIFYLPSEFSLKGAFDFQSSDFVISHTNASHLPPFCSPSFVEPSDL